MHISQLRNVALVASLGFGLSGCSFLMGIFAPDQKAAQEAEQARADELAKAKAELEAKRTAALDAGATADQMWEYAGILLEIYRTKQEENLGVDPSWLPELESALTSRIEGGLTADNGPYAYALVKLYGATERYDESAALGLEMVKAGVEGPVPNIEMMGELSGYPASETTDAAILEMCPLVRPGLEEGISAFVAKCLARAGGDISKLTWESRLQDLAYYARSSYASGPANGTFTFTAKIKSYKKSFFALGYIENTSGVYLDHAQVTAVLTDNSGAEVATYSGYAMVDEIPPGMRAPVSVLVSDPPKYADVRYEFKPEQADYLPSFVDDLSVEALKPRRTRFGWKVEGKVISAAKVPAQFVKIIVQAFDADGVLVGATSTYADGDKLEPGGEARWDTSTLDTAKKPASFEYIVTGRVAD